MLQNFKQIAYNLFVKFLSIFVAIYINRWLNNPDHLTPEHLADFNIIMVYNSIIIGLLSLGIPSLVQKFYTNEKSDIRYKVFWTAIFYFQLSLYILGIILVFLIFNFSNLTNLILFLGLFTAQYILTLDLNFRSVCDSFGKSWQFSLTDLIGKLIILVILTVSEIFKNSIENINYYLITILSVYILQFILDWIWQKKYVGISYFDFKIIKENIKFFIYIGFSGFFISLYSLTDKLFIDYFGFGDFVLNGYSIAFRILEVFIVIPSLSIPVISSLAKKELDSVKQNLSSSKHLKLINQNTIINKNLNLSFSEESYVIIKWLFVSLAISSISSFGLFLLGPLFIRVIDSSMLYYDYASQSLNILAFALIPVGVVIYSNMLLIFFDREKYNFISILFITIFTLFLYQYIIKDYGHWGAAWSSLISIFTDAVIKLILLFRASSKRYKLAAS
jgi:O-antigen/teichoic acid export membrane protein